MSLCVQQCPEPLVLHQDGPPHHGFPKPHLLPALPEHLFISHLENAPQDEVRLVAHLNSLSLLVVLSLSCSDVEVSPLALQLVARVVAGLESKILVQAGEPLLVVHLRVHVPEHII